ncbi:uncharacterized protein LOC116258688 [Nymphaea colorata]|nr:uncharacterized protein LOC116258688 [Nymphaea colorata]
MEEWVPLFNIFLHSRSAEGEASFWMQQNPMKASTFLALLTRDVLYYQASAQQYQRAAEKTPSSPPSSSSQAHSVVNKCMWIETLPNAMQSKILSFLTIEHLRFHKSDLCLLATNILKQPNLEFWVMKSAKNLLNTVRGDGLWPVHLDTDDEFNALPQWLKDGNVNDHAILPWLPLSPQSVSRITSEKVSRAMDEVFELQEEEMIDQVMDDSLRNEDGHLEPVSLSSELEPSIRARALKLKEELLSFGEHGDAIRASHFADEIRNLCGLAHTMSVLGIIEPWKADNATALHILNNLVSENESCDYERLSQVMCSFLLPSLLVLNEPASRLLMSNTLKYAKLHQSAAADAIFLPLILRNEGMNIHICDVLSRIVRECMHSVQLSSLCQKLLTEESLSKVVVCQPCHRKDFISDCLVWTEPLIVLFQNMLNQNVYLTEDTVDSLVSSLRNVAERFSKSLKFVNFIIFLVGRYGSLLKVHKVTLLNMAENTDTFISSSLISKLNHL